MAMPCLGDRACGNCSAELSLRRVVWLKVASSAGRSCWRMLAVNGFSNRDGGCCGTLRFVISAGSVTSLAYCLFPECSSSCSYDSLCLIRFCLYFSKFLGLFEIKDFPDSNSPPLPAKNTLRFEKLIDFDTFGLDFEMKFALDSWPSDCLEASNSWMCIYFSNWIEVSFRICYRFCLRISFCMVLYLSGSSSF